MNLAYTSATLGLHLDLPFYEYTPGVQVHLYGSDSPGRGKWPFRVTFFLKVEPSCDQT